MQISPKPSGAPVGKVPLQVLKELEHQSKQNLSTINFTATFARTASSCNTVMDKCLHSAKATFKRVKIQILKGADPERAARRGYENACDYFDLMNKRILIQQRALACCSISVAHILQRELYTMGNTGLLRREAEMTLLQPHLGDSRRQELRNSPFWPTPLFKSQLVKDGQDFLLKKGTPKDSQGFGPYQNKSFRGPHHHKKEAPAGNAPMGAIPLKAVTNRFPQLGGNRTSEATGVVFDPTQVDEGVETPSPNDSFQASLSRRSPPFFQKRLAHKQMFRRVKHCHQWLRSSIHVKTKFSQSPSDSVRLQVPSKRTSSDLLYPVSSVKERNRKGGKCKISRVLQSPVSCTQASPKVEASYRPKQAQHLPTCRKVQNGNTRIHQGFSDSRGMGVVDKPSRRLPSHPHPPKLKEVPKVLPQLSGVLVHFPSLRTSHGPSGLCNDCKRGEADGPVKGNQTSPVPGRLADQGPVSGRSKSEHSDSGGLDSVLRVDNKSGKVRTKRTQVFSFVGYEYHLDSALVKPTQERWLKLQYLIIQIKRKHVLTARCLMSLIGLLASTEKMVPVRPFQFHLKEHWRFPQLLDTLLPWTETISAHLEWWQNPTNVMKGSDLHPKDHSIQLFTDASNEG